MISVTFYRHAYCVVLAAACLSSCSASQPPALAAYAQVAGQASSGSISRIMRRATKETLLYAVGGCGGTCILSYPEGKLVGQLTGYVGNAICSDNSGNVFISQNTQVVEFAHGGTAPIAIYGVPYSPANGCSVDPTSGSLAVVNGSFVSIFPQGSTKATSYSTLIDAHYCTYDSSGNLFVDGFAGQNPGLSELAKGSSAFAKLTIDSKVGQPGQLQWYGKYLTYEDVQGNQNNQRKGIISRLSISGSVATIVGQTTLKKVPNVLTQSSIYNGSLIAPYSVTGPNPKNLGIWKYPRGGKPSKRITKFGDFDKTDFDFAGVTISVAP